MSGAGNDETRLIIIRGNSASGKSALAAAVRAARLRGIAIIGQDQLRRDILHAKEEEGTPAADYISLSARFALERGMHAIIEGILYEYIYGDMLRELVADHRGVTRCYRYDVPFEETLRRHATKPSAGSYGSAEMSRWWRDSDRLHGVDEAVIPGTNSLEQSTAQILRDCGW